MTLKNNRAHLLYYIKLCASFESHGWIQTWVTVRKHSIRVKIGNFFPCDLEIWWMTLENKRAPLLYYIKLCASFQNHGWIQTGATVRKRSIQVKISNFLSRVTLKFYEWPWKSRAPLLCCFKVFASFHSHWWIQTRVTVRKRPIWVKIDGFFLSHVTLKFDKWPWKTIGHLFYATSSFVHHFIAICEFKMELQSRKAKFGSKSIYLSYVTFKFDRWPWETIGHLFYASSSFVHHFIAICEFEMELQSENAKFGSKSAFVCHVWPWNLTNDLEKH